MVSDIEQRKIFWLLKRCSSLTYWRDVANSQQRFLALIESVVQNHPDNDPNELELDIYKRSLNDIDHLERGLRWLAQGNRSVFHRHEEGFLVQSTEGFSHLATLIWQNDCEDNPDSYITRGGELLNLADAISLARRGALGALEPKPEQPAAYSPTWALLPEDLPKHPFPDPLPPLPPPPSRPRQVKTGRQVPVDGIYAPNEEGTCMNYLLGGTIAPTVLREYGELKESIFFKGRFIRDTETIPTTWHLIWEDHRYEDGTVPEEEKDYFLPMPETPLETPQSPDGIRRALPGEACTRPGYWSTLAKSGSRRCFKQGEVFPDFPESKIARTIWNYDPDQEERG
ncbi:Imm72 family immunity protein [Holophaga foetida]|uniref:Imm72 family immunity protein n=1 Tax=Holophaga foetida TaxID=35839 RepID=UPI00024745F7|nr:Imm72 family immunity protein [Holophaga foetida]